MGWVRVLSREVVVRWVIEGENFLVHEEKWWSLIRREWSWWIVIDQVLYLVMVKGHEQVG